MKYRPDKRTRAQISELEKELLTLNKARASLAVLREDEETEPRVSKRAKIVVRDVVAEQSGVLNSTDESMAEKLKYVLSLTEKTDKTVEKWINETNLNSLYSDKLSSTENNITYL